MIKKTTPSDTLDAQIADRTLEICQQGYQSFDQSDYKTALRRFYSAWTLLPKPQTQWQQAGWILTALGDAYFAKGEFDNACEALRSALHCPKALGNPIIHLRLGQSLYELQDTDNALQQFKLAHDSGGEALFAKVPAKYREFFTRHYPSLADNTV